MRVARSLEASAVLCAIAIAIVALDVGRAAAAEGDLARGEALFDLCAQCHGADGGGNKMFLAPAIAGLEQWYVEMQLEKFRNGQRGRHFDDVASRPRTVPKHLAVDPVPVTQQETRSRFPRKGFPDLLRRPLRRGMGGDVQMQNPASIVWANTTNTNKIRNVTVGTTKKSTATNWWRWFFRKARQVFEGGLR